MKLDIVAGMKMGFLVVVSAIVVYFGLYTYVMAGIWFLALACLTLHRYNPIRYWTEVLAKKKKLDHTEMVKRLHVVCWILLVAVPALYYWAMYLPKFAYEY